MRYFLHVSSGQNRSIISYLSVMFIQTFSHLGTTMFSNCATDIGIKALLSFSLLNCSISSIEQVSMLTPVVLFFFCQFQPNCTSSAFCICPRRKPQNLMFAIRLARKASSSFASLCILDASLKSKCHSFYGIRQMSKSPPLLPTPTLSPSSSVVPVMIEIHENRLTFQTWMETICGGDIKQQAYTSHVYSL